MFILNDIQLNQILLSDLNSIVDEVMDWLNEKLLDSMQDNVYNAGSPQWYDRRQSHGDGFFQSFNKNATATVGQVVTGAINHDPDLMANDPDTFTHGSHTKNFPPDVREFIAQMVIEGSSGPRFGSGFWTQPRDFFGPMEKLFTDGSVDRQIEKALTSRGIIWRRF
jgi:hypothetical protein